MHAAMHTYRQVPVADQRAVVGKLYNGIPIPITIGGGGGGANIFILSINMMSYSRHRHASVKRIQIIRGFYCAKRGSELCARIRGSHTKKNWIVSTNYAQTEDADKARTRVLCRARIQALHNKILRWSKSAHCA